MFRLIPVSFRARLIVGAVLCVALVQFASHAIDIQDERQGLETRLQERANILADVLSNLVALPLWDFNFTVLQNMVEGLAADNSTNQVQLADVSGEVVAEWRIEGFSISRDDLIVERTIHYEHDGERTELGTLMMRFPRDGIAQKLRAEIIQKAVAGLILMLTTGLSLYIVLIRLSAPLTRILATIEHFRHGDFGQPVPETSRRDEIGRLAVALERLRETETEMRILRADHDEQTRRDRHRIVRALQSTDDAVLLIDENGTVAFRNERARQYLGEVAPGDRFNADIFADPIVGAQIRASIEQNGTLHLTATTRSPVDGSARDLRLRVDPIRDETGGALGTVLLGSDTTEQLRQKRRADYLALHDSLTGLPNRRMLEEELSRWIEHQREDTTLLLGDIDRFKQINDTLGHSVGDALLKQVARMIRATVSEADVPVRLGGDEFAIIARGPGCHERVVAYATELIRLMSETLVVEHRAMRSGMSIGIASATSGHHTTSEMFQMADLALYEAKRTGRGRYCIFREDLLKDVHRKNFIEDALRHAISDPSQIRPVYQRQTDLRTGQTIGFEALARWTHPEAGVISPAEFIPVAEDSNQIEALTTEILYQSLVMARELHDKGFTGRVAVNISPKLFGGSLYEIVTDALMRTGCPASSVEIEITEHVLLDSSGSILRQVERLQAIGITVALDDFGVGYSSLSYLQRFPVDKIKIDRTFVSSLTTSSDTEAIVIAIVQLGHALNMSVTGEGAETEADRAALRKCGVDAVQGWVDGKPIEAADLRSLGPETDWKPDPQSHQAV